MIVRVVLLRENIDSSPVATETSVLTKLSYPIPGGGARTWVTGAASRVRRAHFCRTEAPKRLMMERLHEH